jgi:hypothetical protein
MIHVSTAPAPPLPLDDAASDFDFPQREAAFFYGLFLRGHAVDQLRRDIEVPTEVRAKWNREASRKPEQRAFFERIMEYRRQVLAIFDSLLNDDTRTQRIQ